MATNFVGKFKRYLKEDEKSPKTIEKRASVDGLAVIGVYIAYPISIINTTLLRLS